MQPKLKLLKVLDILKETDKTHPITAVGICNKLSEFGIDAERKSVCRDIKTLIEYGYKITLSHDNKLGYYMEKASKTEFDYPVTLDLIKVTVECKKEDKEEVVSLLGNGSAEEDGDYLKMTVGVSSSALFPLLFTLGTKAKLIEPSELKEEFEKKLSDTAEFYKKRRANEKIDVWLL